MIEYLSKIHFVDAKIIEKYFSYWTELEAPKKTIITAEGEIEKNLYFVKRGIQKLYFLKDNKEHILAFSFAPAFTTIPQSFFYQLPSNCYLETISDSQFLKIPYTKHQQLIDEHREIETLFRKLTEHLLIDMIERHVVPTAVLIGHKTGSAAEDFLIYADNQEHIIKIGEKTYGSTGQPLIFKLPGGGFGRVCTKKDTYADGKEFVGYGIQPDIEIKKTVKDYLGNKDVILNEAIKYLKKTTN